MKIGKRNEREEKEKRKKKKKEEKKRRKKKGKKLDLSFTQALAEKAKRRMGSELCKLPKSQPD